MEYPLPKKDARADKANSKGEVLYKTNVDTLEDCLELSPFFQNPT